MELNLKGIQAILRARGIKGTTITPKERAINKKQVLKEIQLRWTNSTAKFKNSVLKRRAKNKVANQSRKINRK